MSVLWCNANSECTMKHLGVVAFTLKPLRVLMNGLKKGTGRTVIYLHIRILYINTKVLGLNSFVFTRCLMTCAKFLLLCAHMSCVYKSSYKLQMQPNINLNRRKPSHTYAQVLHCLLSLLWMKETSIWVNNFYLEKLLFVTVHTIILITQRKNFSSCLLWIICRNWLQIMALNGNWEVALINKPGFNKQIDPKTWSNNLQYRRLVWYVAYWTDSGSDNQQCCMHATLKLHYL